MTVTALLAKPKERYLRRRTQSHPLFTLARMTTRHHTKDKGDLAVARVLADLVGRGVTVLLPFTEHAPFDLVAHIGDAFYRIQVKFRSAKNGRVQVLFRSSWADKHGTHHRPMPRDAVDVIAIYCPDTDITYYLNPADFRLSASVRIHPSRNGQVARVVHASACLAFPPASCTTPRTDPPDTSPELGECGAA